MPIRCIMLLCGACYTTAHRGAPSIRTGCRQPFVSVLCCCAGKVLCGKATDPVACEEGLAGHKRFQA